jgi:hypothetical protein
MAATESATEIRPFEYEVPREELDDLPRRIAATRWPEKETVDDRSQGVQLATVQELARYWAEDYDFGRLEARLNAVPQFVTELDGLDIHFIHVRSPHEDALPVIVNHGWPGSIVEQLKIIDRLTDPPPTAALQPTPSTSWCLRCRARVLRQADRHRLGPRAHGPSLGRADATPRVHPLRRPGRRLGRVRRRPDGPAGTRGTARDPHEHAGHGSGRHRQGVLGR